MKVVASTKLTRAEKAMREAKKYGAANNGELARSNLILCHSPSFTITYPYTYPFTPLV